MRISARIEDDAILIETNTLQFIDQFAFHITLIIADFDVGVFVAKRFEVGIERFITVDVRFPFAEKVKVGAVDDGYFHAVRLLNRLLRTKGNEPDTLINS